MAMKWRAAVAAAAALLTTACGSETPQKPATTTTPSPITAAVGVPPPSASPAAARWQPKPGLSWQWQLSGDLDLTVDAEVYDVDAFTTSAAQVATLHEAGRRVICYVNAGAYESFRPDKDRFPREVLGQELDGWPDERWLDIRRWDLLEPILRDRFSMCQQKGFDAVEPDNVDAFANDSGFPLTAADQLKFNRQVARLAQGMGLAVGLKNDVDQASELAADLDFAVNEECAHYGECHELGVFTSSGKAVFHAEYDLKPAAFCPVAKSLRLSSIHKRLSLDAWRETCP